MKMNINADVRRTWCVPKITTSLKNRFAGMAKARNVTIVLALEALMRSDKALLFLFDQIVPEDPVIQKIREMKKNR